MAFQATQELLVFFSNYLADGDPDTDEQAAKTFGGTAPPHQVERVVAQAKGVLAAKSFSLEELGTASNRWFAEAEEARAWLERVVGALESAQSSSVISVKDSNGAPLLEGDSVVVIKDLKVKGGTSDLKRGTLIKKIHLVDDSDVVECRVDGSTLVLKTMFLKKA